MLSEATTRPLMHLIRAGPGPATEFCSLVFLHDLDDAFPVIGYKGAVLYDRLVDRLALQKQQVGILCSGFQSCRLVTVQVDNLLCRYVLPVCAYRSTLIKV